MICTVPEELIVKASGRSKSTPSMGRRHRRIVVSVMVVSQLLLATLTATAVLFAFHRFNGNIAPGDEIEHVTPEPPKVKGPNQPLNVLIMGSDARDGIGNNIDGLKGDGERSDTTILLHISASRKAVYGVSIPRDTMIDRPTCEVDGEKIVGENPVMFNTAFAVGGKQCTLQTVESLTDIYINHFIVLDFHGFQDMVDAVDGVQVCIPEDVDDDEHNIHFEAGTQELTGRDALNYVRERTVLSNTGDIGRMKRQQAFIGSMINKVMSAGTLSRPDRVYSFLDAVTKSIKVDEDLDTVQSLFKFVTQFKNTDLERIKFVTVPFEEYAPDPNRLQFAPDAEKLWKRIRNDEPLGEKFGEGSLSADAGVGSVDGTTTPPPSSSGTQTPGGTTTPGGPTSTSPSEAPSVDP